MGTPQLREIVHDYINQADERFIQLVYGMVQADKSSLDSTLKEKLTARALTSEQDIKDGRVLSREEMDSKLDAKFGI